MNPDELRESYAELTRLAEQLETMAKSDGSNDFQRVMVAVGLVLAKLTKVMAESKIQLEEVVTRQRGLERSSASLRDERAIRFLAHLKTDDRERLVSAVENGPPNISIRAFAEQISKAAQLTGWQINIVLQWVGGWYPYLGDHDTEDDVNRVASMLVDVPCDRATAELLQAVDASNPNSPFRQQLKRLLRCPSTLGVSSKAEMLLARNERQFGQATISTDLRPIFGRSVEMAPAYGVVLHNLVLAVNDGGVSRSIGLAMTSSDILALADVLNRAWKKEDTLRKHGTYKVLPLNT